MRDKYKNNRKFKKYKKQRFVVRTAAPPQLLPYTTQDVLTTAIYPNMGQSNSYHSHYTTWDSTQLSAMLHNLGLPSYRGSSHNCHLFYTIWNTHTTNQAS